jgi:hypothetical protein
MQRDFEFPKNHLGSVTVFSVRPFRNVEDNIYLGQCIKSRRPWWADVTFSLDTYYIQCVWVQKGWFKDSKRVSIMQTGNLANSMGLEWTGICICVSTTTISSKGLYTWNNSEPTHTHCLSCFVQKAVYSFPLQVNNRPHKGAMNLRLSLKLLA